MKTLVIGGTGYIGGHVAERLRGRGFDVTVLARGRTHAELHPSIEIVHGDRNDSDELKRLARRIPLGIGLAAIGSGLGLGKAVGSAMEAIGRQPEATGRIQTAMIIGCAFIEALTIYALISPFIAGLTFLAE